MRKNQKSTSRLGLLVLLAVLQVMPHVSKAYDVEEVTNPGFECPPGLEYNAETDFCDFPENVPEVLKFEAPRKITTSTTFKIASTGVTITVSEHDYYRCSTAGDGTTCKCDEYGFKPYFGNYKRYKSTTC